MSFVSWEIHSKIEIFCGLIFFPMSHSSMYVTFKVETLSLIPIEIKNENIWNIFLCAVILPFTQHKQCDKNTTALRQHRSYYTTESKSFWWDIFSFCSQRYTYRVLQIIQMKLLYFWAEPAVLGRTKTALKFKYEI